MKIIGLFFSLSLILSNSLLASNLDDVVFPGNRKVLTDSFIVWKDGEFLYEKYARGYSQNSKHISWSMAKTISALLIGVAVKEGLLKLDDKVSKYYPEIASSATVLNVLHMSSGIKYRERYGGVPVNEDVTRMLYLDGPRVGFVDYLLGLKTRDEKPGEHFYYASGDTNLLMGILQKAISNKENYDSYPWDKLFDPLDIKAVFEQDSKGIFVGSSYIYMSARDYVKIGQLILNEGKWNNKQLISVEYMKKFSEIAPGVRKKAIKGTSPQKAYSLQAVVNKPISERGFASEYQNLPLDSILLIGYQGQVMAISPKNKLIILRLSMDYGRSLDKNDVFSAVDDFLEKVKQPVVVVQDLGQKPTTSTEKRIRAGFSFLNLHRAPLLLQAYAAKEACSCHFILGRSLKQCSDDLRNGLPYVPSFKVEGKGIVASIIPGIWGRLAKFKNSRVGCYLPSSE